MKRRRKDMGKQQMKLQDFQNALFTIPHVYLEHHTLYICVCITLVEIIVPTTTH